MTYDDPVTGERTFTMDIPMKDGMSGYVGMFFALFLKFGTILQSPEFSKEPARVYYLTEFMISLIPDDKYKPEQSRKVIREKLATRKIELEKEYRKECGIPDNIKLTIPERDHILVLASIQTIGSLADYIDKYLGVSIENKIGFVKKKDGTLTFKDHPSPHSTPLSKEGAS